MDTSAYVCISIILTCLLIIIYKIFYFRKNKYDYWLSLPKNNNFLLLNKSARDFLQYKANERLGFLKDKLLKLEINIIGKENARIGLSFAKDFLIWARILNAQNLNQ